MASVNIPVMWILARTFRARGGLILRGMYFAIALDATRCNFNLGYS